MLRDATIMVAAGVGIPVLAALNAQLGARIGAPFAAGLVAFGVAALVAAVAVVASGSVRALAALPAQPLHLFFAGFLMAYAYDENAARTCIENDAKARMKQLAMGYTERFCLAARNGELDYFMEVFDMDIANDLTKSTQITTAQKYVRHWAASVGKGALRVPVSDLFTVYIAMHDTQRLTQTKFTQMLGRNDVPVQRLKHGGTKVSCTDIEWFSEMDPAELADVAETPGHKPAHASFH